jgi:succinate dehydrogenase/fumarate reductase flavoprotein subunit
MSGHDVLIIGSGAAGLTAALVLAERCRVMVLAKGRLDGGSTAWAQGGIAAVLDEGDTFEDHVRDTMIAGCGLNRRETVEYVVEHAPRRSPGWRRSACRSTKKPAACTSPAKAAIRTAASCMSTMPRARPCSRR